MPGALLLAAGIALTSGDGLAPEIKGYPSTAGRYSVVLRPALGRAGDPATWRLLLSEARTDAPVESAQLDLTVYGPAGVGPQSARARAGAWPGHYLVDSKEPPAGRYAAMLTVSGTGPPEGATEVLALDGIDIAVPPPIAVRRPPGPWYWGIVAALLLLGFLLRRSRGPAVAAASLGLLLAGGARAHDTSSLPGDRVPGSQVELAQELQFALGVRTQPAAVLTFEAPAGSGLAAREGPGVPRSAVVERDGKKLVFVRLGPERFAAREVRLGWRGAGDTVSVISGLQPGELVVVAGAAFLRNGGGLLP